MSSPLTFEESALLSKLRRLPQWTPAMDATARQAAAMGRLETLVNQALARMFSHQSETFEL